MVTRKISREKIPAIRKFSARDFADWLTIGMTEYATGTGERPFGEAWPYLRVNEDVSEDIAAVHDVLRPAEMKAFREGLAISIAELDLSLPGTISVMRRLLLVAEMVSAKEVLPVLPSVFRTAQALEGGGSEVLRAAVDAAIDLAARTDASQRALNDILASPSFPPFAARAALLALCKAAPDDLEDHLLLLAEHLHALFIEPNDPAGSLPDRRAELLIAVSRRASPSALQRSLERFNPENAHDHASKSISWWGEVLAGWDVSAQLGEKLDKLAQKLALISPAIARDFVPAAEDWNSKFDEESDLLNDSGKTSLHIGTKAVPDPDDLAALEESDTEFA